MAVLEQLEPKRVFHYFEEINQIPRGTFNMEQISNFCVDFAKAHKLEYIQDEVKNVIIKKSGTMGYENSEPVILQGHMDMVCEKTEESNHDFEKDSLELYVEDGFVKAKNTTLGADNGIAIAYAMAVLESNEIAHPPLEVIFTVDEEVGMGGAAAIDLSSIKGRMLINMDSDEEGTIIAGCAGGFRDKLTLTLVKESVSGTIISLEVKGLQGGHSGIEIHKQRGNANKIMGRLLMEISSAVPMFLVDLHGGTKDNVITPFAISKIVVGNQDVSTVNTIIARILKELKDELGAEEPDLLIEVLSTEEGNIEAFTKKDTKKAIFFVIGTPYGVQGYSRELAGLVETSLNLGVVQTEDNKISGVFLVRSAVESKKKELQIILEMWAEQLDAVTEVSGEYPAWMYKTDSKLRPLVMNTYKEHFGVEAKVTTIHAGLECGLLTGKQPELDCVSFGPFMYDIHSVHERLDIASTNRMWEFLIKVLEACK